jgi:hypothetical protein
VGYYLLAVPVKIFGVSLLTPRLMVIAAVAAICVLLALTIAKLTRSTVAGVVFGAAFAALPLVQGLGAVLRVDLVGLALSAGGLCLFSRGRVAEDTKDAEDREAGDSSASSAASPRLFFSAALFVAAIFCKHSLLAAPAACALYLAARSRWREAAKLVGFAAALSVGAFAAAEWPTRGFFAEHLFLTHPDPFSWNGYALRISRLAMGAAPLLALATVRVIWELRRKQLSVAAWWLLLATITAITAGKQGSGWNHFLEWEAALCLCAGLGWEIVRRARPAALVFTAGLAVMWAWPAQSMFDWSNGLQQCPQAYAYIRGHPGDRVLSENVSALLLGGKTVWVLDPFVYSQIVMHGTWRDEVMEPRLRSGWFDMVVTRRDYTRSPDALQRGVERFSAGMLQGLAQNYRIAGTFQCTDANVVWERNPVE